MPNEMELIRARCAMEACLVEKLQVQIDHCKIMKKYDMLSEESFAEFSKEIDRLRDRLEELAERLRRV